MALIHLVACQNAPALAHDLEPALPTAWRCQSARWMPSARALGKVDGEPVVVSGSSDRGGDTAMSY